MEQTLKPNQRSRTDQRKTMTPPQLARQLGVSTNKILAFIRSGELRALNLAASAKNKPRYVILLDDIETFEQSRAVVPRASITRRASVTDDEVKKFVRS